MQRGVFIYCAEGTDNGEGLQLLSIDKDTAFKTDGEFLIADGYRAVPSEKLYSEYTETKQTPTKIKLLPYYRWGNRGENEMSVYLNIK